MRRSAQLALFLAAVPLSAGSPDAAPLGLHEARILVEHTAVFADAIKEGECPQTGDSAVNGTVATVIVREGCNGGHWIASFFVNLTTGIVTEDPAPEGSSKIETPQLAQLRTSLFALRAAQRISPSEASCLINQIPHPGAADSCSSVRIERVGEDFIYGTMVAQCSNQANKVIHVIVNRYSGELKDENSGEVFTSPGIENTRATILAAHSPPTLTVDQAKRLVEAAPVVAEVVRHGLLSDNRCTNATAETLGNADETWFQLAAGCGQSKEIARLSVNVVDGTIRSIEKNTTIDSPPIQELHKAALAQAQSLNANATRTLQEKCPSRQP